MAATTSRIATATGSNSAGNSTDTSLLVSALSWLLGGQPLVGDLGEGRASGEVDGVSGGSDCVELASPSAHFVLVWWKKVCSVQTGSRGEE